MKKTKLFIVAVLLIANYLFPTLSFAQYTKLCDFTGANANHPYGSLVSDGTFLYGMSERGGTPNLGMIFKIKPDGTSYTHLFDFNIGKTGKFPQGSLIYDGTFLYGMTSDGGYSNDGGIGTVFKIKPDGTGFDTLMTFNGKNGARPFGSLVSDGIYLYGMTNRSATNAGGPGVIFKIKKDGTNGTTLMTFNVTNGRDPYGSLIFDGTFLYGMTSNGGTYSVGNIFKIKPDGTGFDTLMTFNSTNGARPFGSLVSEGIFLYGMTQQGGPSGNGLIFKIKPDGTGFDTLMTFNGKNGRGPYGSLISDGTFLYGMTQNGGAIASDSGTVFKIKLDGTGYSNLLDFIGTNGSWPRGSLVSDGTFLYGMTPSGGTKDNGTIFKIKPDGTGYNMLMDLINGVNGSWPYGSLISDGTFLYGMTRWGGDANGNGNIFKIKSDGTSYNNLLNFNITNGASPYGDLTSVSPFLYGMTYGSGSASQGNVFKIKPDGTGFVNLKGFTSINGDNPTGSLISDGTFLYGMTEGGTNGNAIIFKIKPDGTSYSELMNFNFTNGANPYGSLIFDGTFLYGMTSSGGTMGKGLIFKIKTDGTNYTDLFDFNNINGWQPMGSLISDGNFLYGMTQNVGTQSYGTIFKIKPDGTSYTELIRFNGTDGNKPMGSLISDGIFLYGMTSAGGTNNYGVLFKIKNDGTDYTQLLNFNGTNGKNPQGSLISDGIFLYGMTQEGGNNGLGTIFKYQYCTSVAATQSYSLCTGQSLTVGSHNYTTSGTYIDTISSYQGCDSMITSQVTILPTNNSACMVNCFANYTTVYDTLQNTFTLIVDSTTTAIATSYHWDFGDGNTSTLATPNHTYTVDTVYNVCLKITTASNDTCPYCHVIGKDYLGNIYRTSGFTINVINSNLTGVSSTSSNENRFIVFPNPTNGETEIMFNRSVNNITIRVFNVTGQKIVEKINVSGSRFNIDISNQTSGVYFIEIISDDNVQRGKLIKQ